MTLHEALHGLAEKFTPMSEKSSVDLQMQAQQNYFRVLDEAQEIDKANATNAEIEQKIGSGMLTEGEGEILMKQIVTVPKEKIEHKVIRVLDKWWMRYVISAFFVWVQPKIQNYLNPPPPVSPDEFED